MKDCIFCKISKKETEAKIIFEDEDLVIFPDINPKAPVHLLIVPKKHIDSIKDIEEADAGIIARMILAAKDQAQKQNLKGYKLIFNVGRAGGQIIDHIHLHLLGFD